jgi:hypothetical protein
MPTATARLPSCSYCPGAVVESFFSVGACEFHNPRPSVAVIEINQEPFMWLGRPR